MKWWRLSLSDENNSENKLQSVTLSKHLVRIKAIGSVKFDSTVYPYNRTWWEVEQQPLGNSTLISQPHTSFLSLWLLLPLLKSHHIPACLSPSLPRTCKPYPACILHHCPASHHLCRIAWSLFSNREGPPSLPNISALWGQTIHVTERKPWQQTWNSRGNKNSSWSTLTEIKECTGAPAAAPPPAHLLF